MCVIWLSKPRDFSLALSIIVCINVLKLEPVPMPLLSLCKQRDIV